MGNFPRWTAPFVGAIVGALCGLQSIRRGNRIPVLAAVLGGAAIGAIAGLIIMLLDYSPKKIEPADPLFPGAKSIPGKSIHNQRTAHSSSLVGRFLALVTCLLCWFPLLGLLLAISSTIVNWKSKDWTRRASWIAGSIALFITLGLTILLILEQ